HMVACVAVLSRYSESPARIAVQGANTPSRWLGGASRFVLEVAWRHETASKAARLRSTMQLKPQVEMAATALALVLSHHVLRLGELDVTNYGDHVDFRSLSVTSVLEISGTETLSDLGRRH